MQITSSSGLSDISRLASWQYWRKRTDNFATIIQQVSVFRGRPVPLSLISGNEMIAAAGKTICPHCHGRFHQITEVGDTYCLCAVLDYQSSRGERSEWCRTPFLNVIEPERMDRRKNKTLTEAIETVVAFVDNPDRWLLIIGDRGVGKTNLLQWTARELGPMALYISADDFEDSIHSAMQDHAVSEMIETIKQTPILLFDDWGIEYGKSFSGESFIEAKLRSIINWRYALWQEFPTVVTTNLSISQLTQRDSRTTARLRDRDKATIVPIMGLEDYRGRMVRNG